MIEDKSLGSSTASPIVFGMMSSNNDPPRTASGTSPSDRSKALAAACLEPDDQPELTEVEETHQITGLLCAWQSGDEEALARLIPRVYHRLGRIAGSLVHNENADEALQATALVHEAFLRIVELERIEWQSRAHFFSMCARLMRRVLVDRARHFNRQKRAGWGARVDTSALKLISHGRPPDLVALDEALTELAELDAEMAQVVELRFFCGLDRKVLGEVLGISGATVTRRWRAARAWLLDRLSEPSA